LGVLNAPPPNANVENCLFFSQFTQNHLNQLSATSQNFFDFVAANLPKHLRFVLLLPKMGWNLC